jgi:hypothetical protein
VTTVILNLRSDTSGDKVDLDALTPKARALAEAIDGLLFRNRVDIYITNPALGEVRTWRGWAAGFPARATPEGYLEIEARKFPPGWQISAPSPRGGRSLHQCDPGQAHIVRHADDLMNRDTTLGRLRERGLAPSIDEFCRRTAHGDMTRPARYVETGTSSTPLWSAAEIDAWMREQRITATEAAELMGVATGRNARSQLDRWGVRPIGRAAGRGGESLYDTAEVRDAIATRPGRGARTDLQRAEKES